ncbi:MAG: hypothetical protein IPP51_12185 [Bacteroidetes bacterium]|nr:hypothetical protein [Bacteroidota bacterium]
MAEQLDLKTNFSALESRIQKLIHLHEELKKSNQQLLADNNRLMLELDDERNKIRRLEEGYKNLKEIESSTTKQSITNMKRRINDIIVEIDKNMALIDDNHK